MFDGKAGTRAAGSNAYGDLPRQVLVVAPLDMPLPDEGDAYVVTLRRCDSGGVAALCVYADGTMWTDRVRTRLDGPDCPKATYMLDDGGRLYSLCAEITDGGEVRP